MPTVKLSPKYQVVIPRNIRDSMDLHPGQNIRVLSDGMRIELIPEPDLREMRGFLRGIDTTIEREEDRV